MSSRERFEAWITSSPYEQSVERQSDKGAWPGQYRSYETQSAWEAWQEAVRQTREECAVLCEQNRWADERARYIVNECAGTIRAMED